MRRLNANSKFLSSDEREIDPPQQLSRQEDDINLSISEDGLGLLRISDKLNGAKQEVWVCRLDRHREWHLKYDFKQ